MTRQLVLVHGRSQAGKDPDVLKAEWLESLDVGLGKSGLTLPIPESAVRFAYYGDTLDQLVQGEDADSASRVVIRGRDADPAETAFLLAVLSEVLEQSGLTDAQLAEAEGADVIERKLRNRRGALATLRLVDRYVPFASARTIDLITHDVYLYLHDAAIRQAIDEGVRAAFRPDVETVVVAHSLGTVLAYNLMRQQGSQLGWQVRDFITLGSPLAVTAIARRLAAFNPIRCPQCVTSWFNAMDRRDAVALYPLTRQRFPLHPDVPAIENMVDVRNRTDNRHGIVGYLDDAEVAKRIHRALSE